MQAIAIVEEGIGMGTGVGWLLCFAAAGFLSWALYQSFVVHGRPSAEPQNPTRQPLALAQPVKARFWPNGK